MERLEAEILATLGIADPYADRRRSPDKPAQLERLDRYLP